MEILRTIALYVEGKEMPFLVIGGHAVNAYGISRQTADIDLVVALRSKAKWAVLMEKLRYVPGQNDDRFARFRPDSLANWPIDLMYVDDLTFQKLDSEAVERSFGEARAKVVSARHLATMKIHALKHYQEHRYVKDYSDLVSLLRSGAARFTPEELQQLCERYATIELYQRLQADLEKK